MTLISIILPIYNKEEHLTQTINTVLNQTYTHFELILINDGSTDGSADLAKEILKKDNRVKYFYHENRGVSYSRNKGLYLAQGKYVSFLDADDQWHPTFLEKMLNTIDSNNVCYSGHIQYINKVKQHPRITFYKGDILEKYINNITTPNTNSWLINKTYLQQFNIRFPIDLDWGEDMTFFSKVLLHDKNIQVVPEYLTEYHLGDYNNLSENKINKIEKDIFWMNEIKKYIFLNEKDESRKKKLLNAFDSYRIPASIIYRLWSNKDQISFNDYIRYSKYLSKINLSNRYRSFKLVIYHYRLRYFLKTLSA